MYHLLILYETIQGILWKIVNFLEEITKHSIFDDYFIITFKTFYDFRKI